MIVSCLVLDKGFGKTAPVQFEFSSHSHRGFSPVINEGEEFLNRVNGLFPLKPKSLKQSGKFWIEGHWAKATVRMRTGNQTEPVPERNNFLQNRLACTNSKQNSN